MKFTLITAAALLVASANAAPRKLYARRFGQEQAVQLQSKLTAAIPHCQGFSSAAGQIGGESIGTLLAAADPCNKLRTADAAVAAAKAASCDAQGLQIVLDAAMDLVHGEKNFNPFVTNLDGVCLDASLPVTPELRGIPPLVDPRISPQAFSIAVPAGAQAAAAKVNAATNQILAAAKAAGKGPGSSVSVAQQLVDLGFSFIQNAGSLTPSGNGASAAPAPAPAATTAQAEPAAPTTPPAPVAAGNKPSRTVTVTVTTTITPAATACAAPAAAITRAPSAPSPTSNTSTPGAVLFSPAPVLGLQGVPLVRSSDPQRTFQVAQDTFVGAGAACGRVGDKLFNQCANALNAGHIPGKSGNDISTICQPASDNAKSQCLAAVANL
ncbi:hypothetical protein BDK51DRAFT_39533 [Blyttiomyces helicus]|uniref:Uncharacterized protein n=1 Tax=Blyttiomyces helicus TaxID=388810 RepID=A0A4P9W7W3_9FUNG|nr:hypothetical protein BDK51DRAFT_39533 [Blyttiomyces helicus]|eukprot:RKO88474.1 hypothetical protein BDK51DRAFT_39533 [Blyttiomyces helicus]